MKCSLLLVYFCLALPLVAQTKASVELVKQVEPDWGTLTTGYVTDTIVAELTVLPSGEPFSVKNGGPDPVVRALMQWRFKRQSNAFAVPIRIPIRRKLTPDLERSLKPITRTPYQLATAIRNGKELDAGGAAQILANLPNGEEPDNFRASLLTYYAEKGAGSPETSRKARLDLITWLIRTFPQDRFLATSYAVINASGEPLADKDGVEQVKKAWLDAVKQYPTDTAVTENAAVFLRTADPESAWRVVNPQGKWDQRLDWLASIFAYAGLGVNAVSPKSGVALSTTSPQLPADAFAARSRNLLLTSTDLQAVLVGVDTTITLAKNLTAHNALPAGYAEYCDSLIKHVRELYPETSLSCSDDRPGMRAQHVGGGVMEANIIKKVQARYPQAAKNARITGRVEFTATVGIDGKVQSLSLVEAPFALYDEAYNAVMQWEYRPTMLNGNPVPVITDVIVNFTLAVSR